MGELIDRPNGDIAFPEDGDKVLSLSDSSPHFNFNAFLGDLSQCVYIGDVLAGIKVPDMLLRYQTQRCKPVWMPGNTS